MNKIRTLWQFVTHPPKAQALAAKELENAKRSYLENKTHAEYYSTLCSFETQRIARLEKYLEPSLEQPS
jgi:flagellar biosynthesis chaperone FliJ